MIKNIQEDIQHEKSNSLIEVTSVELVEPVVSYLDDTTLKCIGKAIGVRPIHICIESDLLKLTNNIIISYYRREKCEILTKLVSGLIDNNYIEISLFHLNGTTGITVTTVNNNIIYKEIISSNKLNHLNGTLLFDQMSKLALEIANAYHLHYFNLNFN